MTRSLTLALSLSVALLAGCGSPENGDGKTAAPPASQESSSAAAAPAFSLPDNTGKTHALADYRGKWVVLEWVNHGCPFVKKHYGPGNMQGLQKRYAEKGVIWLSICSSAPGKQGHQDAAGWTETLKSIGAAPTAMLLDVDGKVGRLYDAKTTPQMVVIDPQGAIVYGGAIDDRPTANSADIAGARNYVVEVLDAVLSGKPAPVTESKPYGCSVKY